MIRKLPPQVVQQIAAGEVVERPASVLKELIENSLDAGAKSIQVCYDGGGKRLLRVSDDGQGIRREELPLAFESHATSKLQKLDDLDRLMSMGFRGEAVSVISSVSKLKIWTSTEQEKTGQIAQVAFGHWQGVEAADKRVGTEVELSNLFERLPVRMKFLKSDAAETRQLFNCFKTYALAYPEKRWQIQDLGGRRTLSLSPTSALERCLWYFDASSSDQWLECKNEEAAWKMNMFFLKPRYYAMGRQNLQIYLNRRPIKDRKLDFAVRRAFEGYTEFPQAAVGALFLEAEPNQFDVNVHPMKLEVRFKDHDAAFSCVVHGIRNALQKMHQNESPNSSESSEIVSRGDSRSFQFSPKPSGSLSFSGGSGAGAAKIAPLAQEELFDSPNYEYLGSLERTYLLAKRQESLFVFDQHALHERILYEELLKQWKAQKKLGSQRLLFPTAIKADWAQDLLEIDEFLGDLGFEVRDWGNSGVQVVAVPSILKSGYEEALQAICSSRHHARESMLRESLATIACHSAIRAHDLVDERKVRHILEQFQSDDALGHCPHGRPTFVKWSTGELEKMFHRV